MFDVLRSQFRIRSNAQTEACVYMCVRASACMRDLNPACVVMCGRPFRTAGASAIGK